MQTHDTNNNVKFIYEKPNKKSIKCLALFCLNNIATDLFSLFSVHAISIYAKKYSLLPLHNWYFMLYMEFCSNYLVHFMQVKNGEKMYQRNYLWCCYLLNVEKQMGKKNYTMFTYTLLEYMTILYMWKNTLAY